jgi:hypothetical protein
MQTSNKELVNSILQRQPNNNMVEHNLSTSNSNHTMNTYPINKKADLSKNIYTPKITQLLLTKNHKNITILPQSKL